MVDATDIRARALARWEGEGGALAETGAPGSIDESELRILARLGAALLDVWDELSSVLQQKLIYRVTTPGCPADRVRVKEKLARFLHEQRDKC